MVTFKDWLIEVLLWVPRKLWELLLEGLAAVIEAIPVPGFFEDAVDYFGLIPDGVLYFLQAFQVPAGIGMIVGAYVVRFVIRRIPLIG